MSTLQAGTLLAGRYRVGRVLGQGGFGAVYYGEDLVAERPCAIKVLLLLDADTAQQFRVEADLLRQIKSPNIPRVFDVLPPEHGAGQSIVMEYIEGIGLDQLLLRQGGRLRERSALQISMPILQALISLHSQQLTIIHRDIKPQNIKVDSLNNIWLLDLGIAKRLGSPTARGALAATEAYSPPEQLQRRTTDQRSDLFALGATLYHLVTGRCPESALARLAGVDLTPPDVACPGLSRRCADLILRATELDPAQRFSSATEMYRAVEALIDPSLALRTRTTAALSKVISGGQSTIKATRELPPQQPVHSTVNPPLPSVIEQAVAATYGKPMQLYRHQAESVERARKRRDIVVVTGTASGKSMCFNLPVLERCLQDPRASALYLFPIKALINDQATTLQNLTGRILAAGGPAVSVGRLHGDLDQNERQALRANPPRIALSNPDFVHWMLANHPDWRRFFSRLQFIVLDEVHVYRGLFGSHVAMLLRRLLRICKHYGAEPQFICCSATIANPVDLIQKLTGRAAPQLIDRDGAARVRRYVHFWEPLQVGAAERRSVGNDVIGITARAVEANRQVITFARARQEVEQLLARTRAMAKKKGRDPQRYGAYRGGYSREIREKIEGALRSGALRAVYTTSALEMGIDIGGMQLAVLTGYPGSRMSFWQQAGRAGRQQEEAHIVLVGAPNPMDAHFLTNPDDLIYGPAEDAIVDLDNPYVNEGHLSCMAREWPISAGDVSSLPPETQQSFHRLVQDGLLVAQPGLAGADEYSYNRSDLPHRKVNLRGVGNDQYSVIDPQQPEPLGTLSGQQLYREAHEGALYFSQGVDYRVREVDLIGKKIIIGPEPHPISPITREPAASRFTRAKIGVSWQPSPALRTTPIGTAAVKAHCHFGTLRVDEYVTGYGEYYLHNLQKLKQYDFPQPLTLGPLQTKGLWLDITPEVQQAVFYTTGIAIDERQCDQLKAAVHGLEHLLVSLIPTIALCDRRDLGSLYESAFGGAQSVSRIVIYDLVPGGIGLAERASRSIEQLLKLAYHVVTTCACTDGCPYCIQSGWCFEENHCLSKQATIVLLAQLVG
ncbi:MAG: DEAD/DEAH box helicase [Chloroflexales bacterium]